MAEEEVGNGEDLEEVENEDEEQEPELAHVVKKRTIEGRKGNNFTSIC